MRDNIKYMLSNWLKWDRKSLVYFLIRIPALVFQPIVTSYIPKAMIDCINEGATVGRLTLVVGLLSVLVVLTTWLSPFMQELLNGSARIIRMRYAVLAFNKNLNTDYTNIESPGGREKNKRAMEFYRSYYSGSSDFLDSCNQFCVCVVGVAASLALIYKINIIMILIIFATCAAEFFLLGFLNGKEKKTKNERSKIFVRYDYYYNLCRDFSAAKDIRLYGFTDYFLFAIAKIICDLEKNQSKIYAPKYQNRRTESTFKSHTRACCLCISLISCMRRQAVCFGFHFLFWHYNGLFKLDNECRVSVFES